MTDPAALLEIDSVTFGFPERPDFLHPVRLTVRTGEVWGIIGPNGAGKSTLLRLMAGLIRPKSGQIRFRGRGLDAIPPRERARRIAFLPQNPPREVALTVRQVVAMGRYPHRQLGLFESVDDLRIADRAMEATLTAEFADRTLSTLSGGEAQRVHISAALAQEPELLLLDEPTSALDLYHQLSILSKLAGLAEAGGLAVVVVTHDLNLAARYCSRLALMSAGCTVAVGNPADVLIPERLEPVYGVRMSIVRTGEGREWIMPLGPGPGGGGAA
ncbi:MAG: hypothetical protein DCC65_07425 [Planctomycetota bacterium]|nr:MAG: hypothetical protein DCC65_07425 [Planctomycetota bacterium]